MLLTSENVVFLVLSSSVHKDVLAAPGRVLSSPGAALNQMCCRSALYLFHHDFYTIVM